MQDPASKNFWQFEVSDLLKQLNSTEKGLSQQEADKRLLLAGTHKKTISPFRKDVKLFIEQFKSPLMLLLIGAVILSAFLGDTSDVFIILFIVLSTGTLSFFQERNAGRVVEKLQSLIALKCMVLRNGEVKEIASDQIVVGDVLMLKAGDMIPADCLLMEANELHSNEASLTGESYPVRKTTGVLNEHTELAKRTNCLWQGTNIVSGNAKALVTETGTATLFSNITQSISSVTETAFEKGIREFGYFLMKITLVLSIFIIVINLLNHKSILDSALFALALAVGMAPELLPAITTIAMSAGAKRLLSKKVIVKKLSSIQNLGEINLLCTDKTGTITEGAIEVSAIVNESGSEDIFVKELAYWNAVFESGYINPIDEALKKMHFTQTMQPVKKGEVPYDFIRKRLSIAVEDKNRQMLITKGAFKELSGICSKIRLNNNSIADYKDYAAQLEKQFADFGLNGFRTIGIAYKELTHADISKTDETDLIFAGFILLQDPVKQDIPEAIKELKDLQIDLKIITGDNRNVAKSLALKIGIEDANVITGEELLETSPEALVQVVKQAHIFAEVEPQQKERIIQALRKTFTVAYIGDGINDVSAINAADVGLSVSNAVDVAREAADFVLIEKDLTVLADGVKEGRKTFANTLKYVYINTGSTFGNMFSVAAASLMLPFLPMLPKQILLTNFITDFPYLTVASDNVDEEQVKNPGIWNIKLIRKYMMIFGLHSSVFDVITFLVLLFLLKAKEASFQTGWFIESVLTELFILFIIRTHKNFFKSKPAKALLISSFVGLILTLALPYIPFARDMGFDALPFPVLISMMAIVLVYILTADLLKVWFFNRYFKEQN